MLHRSDLANMKSNIINHLRHVALQHKYLLILVAALLGIVAIMNGYDIHFNELDIEKNEDKLEHFKVRPEAENLIRFGIRKKEGEGGEAIFEMEKLF